MPMMRFSFIVLAVKSVWQYYVPVAGVLRLLDLFRRMVNDCLRIGLLNDALSLRKLSLFSYNQLAIRQTTRTQALVRKMSSGNGPGHGCSGQPVSAGTGEVRTFPASHRRGAR